MTRTALLLVLLPLVSIPAQSASQADKALVVPGNPPPVQGVQGRPSGNYSGSYAATSGGIGLNVKLEQDASGRVTGELATTAGLQLALDGTLSERGNVIGVARSPQGAGFFLAELSGDTLTLTVAERLPNGQPNMATAQRAQLQRAAGAAPGGPGQPAMGAASPVDQQLSQLLLSSAWCSFSYSGVAGTSSGRSSTERVVFGPDGSGMLLSGGESYYSNRYGTAAGVQSGGQAFRWQVRGGMLILSMQGRPPESIPLQVTRNSNGYPIVNASGKEYSTCN